MNIVSYIYDIKLREKSLDHPSINKYYGANQGITNIVAVSQSDLEQLAQLILRGSGGQLGAGTPADRARALKAETGESGYDKVAKQLDKTLDSMKKSPAYAADISAFPNKIQSVLQKSNSEFVKKLAGEVTSLEGVFKVQDQLKTQNDLVYALNQYQHQTELSDKEYVKLLEKFEELGLEATELGKYIDANGVKTKEYTKLVEQLEEDSEELSKALVEASKSATSWSDNVNKSVGFLKKAAAIAAVPLTLAIEEARLKRELISADAGYIQAVEKMQISTSDWIRILGDTRQVNLAMTQAGENFTESMVVAQDQLQKFGYSSTQAAQLAGQMHKATARFGVKQENLGDAVSKQIGIYEELYRPLGITSNQFGALTEQLVTDIDTRMQLAKMAEKERRGYIQSIQQREAERLEMGYTADQARELTKTFQQLAGESPRERMKKAARERAMMGALGMGGEAAELQKLMIRLPTLGDKERVEAERRIENIRQKASKRYFERLGDTVASNMTFGTMGLKTGFDQTAKQFEVSTLQGRKIEAERIKKEDLRQREIAKVQDKILESVDLGKAAMQSSVTLLGAGVAFQGLAFAKQALMANILGGGGPSGGVALRKGGLAGRLMKGSLAFGGMLYGLDQVRQAITTGDSDVYRGLDTLSKDLTGESIGKHLFHLLNPEAARKDKVRQMEKDLAAEEKSKNDKIRTQMADINQTPIKKGGMQSQLERFNEQARKREQSDKDAKQISTAHLEEAKKSNELTEKQIEQNNDLKNSTDKATKAIRDGNDEQKQQAEAALTVQNKNQRTVAVRDGGLPRGGSIVGG